MAAKAAKPAGVFAMKPVKSSNIKAIGYNPLDRTLRVEFIGSGIYNFHDVSPQEHAALMAAESHGKHFQTYIRHSHEFTKLST